VSVNVVIRARPNLLAGLAAFTGAELRDGVVNGIIKLHDHEVLAADRLARLAVEEEEPGKQLIAATLDAMLRRSMARPDKNPRPPRFNP
jgi:hypothetical protein